MAFNLKTPVRIDDSPDPSKIHRFDNEKCPVIQDMETDKLYRLKIENGTLTQQEITITDGAIVETGAPITYVKA